MAELVYACDLGSQSCRFESCWGYKKMRKLDTFEIISIFIKQIKKPQMKNLHILLIGGDLAEATFKERV